MKYKMLVLDMDGTLLNKKQEISSANKLAIKKAIDKGIHIVLASGRSFEGLVPYIKELGLESDDHYSVACSGAVAVHNRSREELYSIPIPHEDIEMIVSFCEDYNLDLCAYTQDKILADQDHLFARYDSLANGLPLLLTDFHHVPENEKIYKINITNEAPQMRMDIDSYFPKLTVDFPLMRYKKAYQPRLLDETWRFPERIQEQYHIVKSLPFMSEVFRVECNKAVGVEKIAQVLGINKAEIICVGDSENDLHMLAYAGLGIAMENAYENVKKAADVIAPHHDFDGVAYVIQKYILEEIY